MFKELPAQLIIGPHEMALSYVIGELAKVFCVSGGCKACVACKQIRSQQHHSITMLAPEKMYTREELSPIFSRIVFLQPADDQHIFIIQKAHCLTPSSGNSLLKLLEEPPAGYSFFLIADHEKLVLDTIASRCVLTQLCHPTVVQNYSHPLLKIFIGDVKVSHIAFLKELETHLPTEQQTTELFKGLLSYYQQIYKQEVKSNTSNLVTQTLVQALLSMLAHPIPSGSSKLFWKELYLRLFFPSTSCANPAKNWSTSG